MLLLASQHNEQGEACGRAFNIVVAEGLEAKGAEVDWRVVLSSGAYKKIFVGCSIVEF